MKKKEEAKKSWALHNILCLSVSGCFLLVSCERRQGRADIWQDRKEGVRGRRSPLEGGEETWQEVMEEEAGVGREQRRKRWLNKENTEARKKKTAIKELADDAFVTLHEWDTVREVGGVVCILEAEEVTRRWGVHCSLMCNALHARAHAHTQQFTLKCVISLPRRCIESIHPDSYLRSNCLKMSGLATDKMICSFFFFKKIYVSVFTWLLNSCKSL